MACFDLQYNIAGSLRYTGIFHNCDNVQVSRDFSTNSGETL